MKKLWKYSKIFITILIIAFSIYYFFNNKEDLLKVLNIPTPYLLILAFLYSIIYFLNGLFLKVILKSFKKVIPTLESFYLSVISSLGNYFLPLRGGMVIRSVYLKKKFNFSYTHFISTLSGDYIIVFLVNAFLALLALLFIQIKQNVYSIPLYLFFGGLFVGMLILMFVKFPIEKIKGSKNKVVDKISNVIKSILEGWNIIINDRKLLFSLVFLTIASFITSALIFYFQFRALGIDIEFVNVILYNCLSGVSLLVSLTPGSLGIREGIFSITSGILGINNEEIMQLALLDRGVSVISLIGLGVVLWVSLFFAKKRINENKGFSYKE